MDLYRHAQGQFPAKLSDLYPKYITDLGSFSCPGNPRKIHRPEDIDSLSGYILFAVDTSDTNSLDWLEKLLLTDRRRNHLGKWNEVSGRNIFWGDGSVTWLPDKHATKEIDPYWPLDSSNAFDFPN